MTALIEPIIQDEILNILPNDGPLALALMAQLSANMLLSINGPSFDDFIADVRSNLNFYKELEAKNKKAAN